MIEAMKERMSPEVLAEAAARFGTRPTDLSELSHGENFVYSFDALGSGRILRLGHSLHETAEQVRAELDWVASMADGSVPVARPRPSVAGNQVEVIDDRAGDGQNFVAASFDRAPGEVLDDDLEWDTGEDGKLHERWGALLGRIHHHAKGYRPPGPTRPHWNERDLDIIRQWVPEEALSGDLVDRLRRLPRDSTCYGLNHADLATWNFCVADDQLTAFDFDAAQYSWYAHDIAICLYYAQPDSHDHELRSAFTASFLPRFLKGYTAFCALDPFWLTTLPEFLLLQTIYLLALVRRDHGAQPAEPRVQALVDRFLLRLRGDEPVIDIDFSTMARR